MYLLKKGQENMLAIFTYIYSKIKELLNYKPKKKFVTNAIQKVEPCPRSDK